MTLLLSIPFLYFWFDFLIRKHATREAKRKRASEVAEEYTKDDKLLIGIADRVEEAVLRGVDEKKKRQERAN